MGRLAEAVSRRDPKDPKNRRLYAQYLIETGNATAAVDVLQPLARRLAKDHPEFAEATGLLGRAYKQMFFDAGDKTSPGAREALKQAIAAYRKPFEENRANTWHGVNLLALLTRARRLGLRVAPDLQPKEVAKEVVAALEATPREPARRMVPADPGRSVAGPRRLGRRRAQRQGIRRCGRREGVPDREHAPPVHRGLGSRSDGRSRSRAGRHAARAPAPAAGRRPRDGPR